MYKGKAIYNPSGKAGEYSYWACNFYKGCSNRCTYCYLKKGVLAKSMGQDYPTLKKWFRDTEHAFEVFQKELQTNIRELQLHGLFFTFTSDPLLLETKELTMRAVNECLYNDIPVKLLTKSVGYIDQFVYELECTDYDLNNISWGFTLTGHDELEPGASANFERIAAMKNIHRKGFKTWASIEPIIDIDSSDEMIKRTRGYCDLYKIGLLSGDKLYEDDFGRFCLRQAIDSWASYLRHYKVYFKDSLLNRAGITRDSLPSNCVDRTFNL